MKKLTCLCVVLVITIASASSQTTPDTIRIWKVGDPHTGEKPTPTLPPNLKMEWGARGLQAVVETFPAKGFAKTFFDAVARNAAPDLLVFDNFGVIDGITTRLGHFDGIGQEPTVRQQLIKVTDAFDELLGPRRGWTYLFALSPNHAAAKALALTAPRCAIGPSSPTLRGDLEPIVSKLATAYLEGDDVGVQSYSDPDRLPSTPINRQTTKVGGIRLCGVWGNDKLAVASVSTAYEGSTTLGRTQVLLVLRKPSFQWRLLVAARDPISVGEFMRNARGLGALLSADTQSRSLPIPATLMDPPTGDFPRVATGQRFGSFTWQSSPSEGVAAEIAEFAYDDDARLFLLPRPHPGSPGEISAGSLWTTRRAWYWRIWSVASSGDVVFSEARTFTH